MGDMDITYKGDKESCCEYNAHVHGCNVQEETCDLVLGGETQ